MKPEKNPIRHILPKFIKINDVDVVVYDTDEVFERGKTIRVKFLHRFVHNGTSVLEGEGRINSVGDIYPKDDVVETHKNWFSTHPQDEPKFVTVELT